MKFLLCLFISVIIILLSYSTLSLGIGDNVHYLSNYNNINNLNILDAYKLYKFDIGASEPIYFMISYLLSYIIYFNIFITVLNFYFLILLYSVIKFYFNKYNSIYLLMILSNPYFYVIILETHRLKLSIIFLFLFLLYLKRPINKLYMILSIMSHFQLFIFYIPFYIKIFIVNFLNGIIKKGDILLIVLFLILGYYFNDSIMSKINYYSYHNLQFPYKTIFLVFIYSGYLILFKYKDSLKVYLPISIVVLLLSVVISGDRINFVLISLILVLELDRLLNGKFHTLIILLPLSSYNILKIFEYLKVFYDYK